LRRLVRVAMARHLKMDKEKGGTRVGINEFIKRRSHTYRHKSKLRYHKFYFSLDRASRRVFVSCSNATCNTCLYIVTARSLACNSIA